jgi:hypothetical protein
MGADRTSTLTKSREQGDMPLNMLLIKNASSDWFGISGVKGVWLPVGFTVTTSGNGADTFTYKSVTVNGSLTATATSLIISSGAVKRVVPYYLASAGGEIIEVVADTDVTSATATLTIIRGVLGTTATTTGVANGNTLAILNMPASGAATAGPELMRCAEFVGQPSPTDTFTNA